jgi:hypothetical protein
VQLDHAYLARLTADVLTEARDEIGTSVAEISRRLEQRARDKANAGRRPLRLVEGDFVMVSVAQAPPFKVAARWTGPHEVVECLSEHRYRVQHIVTAKIETVHASRLEYYDDAQANVRGDERLRAQAAHETFGFQVSRIGGHRRAEDGAGWELRPVWRGFEDAVDSQEWRALGDVYQGLTRMVLRYLRRLLRSKSGGKIAEGEAMCHQLELDSEYVATCPLRELGGGAAADDDDENG